MPKTDTPEAAVLDLVFEALSKCKHEQIDDVSYDGDNKSCELILSYDDGKTVSDFRIDVVPIDRGEG